MAEGTEYLGGGYASFGRGTGGLPAVSLREQVAELTEEAREGTVRLAADARAEVGALVRRRQELLADRLGGIAAALRDAGRRLVREAARPAGTPAAGPVAWPAAPASGVVGASSGSTAMPPPLAGPAPARVDAATRGVSELAERAARQMDRAARYVRRSELRGMVRDLEGLARRRPAVLIGGSFATGMLLARFFKSSGERATWSGSGSDLASDRWSAPESHAGAAAGGGLAPEELPGRW
jgi:hypothetical protein